MCFALIRKNSEDSGNRLSVKDMCSMCGVSRSGYYSWLAAADTRAERAKNDRLDFSHVLEAYRFRGYNKGARGIHMRLLHTGIRMNIKKIRRLMKKFGLFCPIRKANPYRRMAKALRTSSVADNFVKREFRLHGPRKIFLTDITYIPFRESFLYLSVIKDAYTEQVMAHVLSESLEVDFVLETVKMFMDRHGGSLDSEAYIHSDQGCHYTSVSFRQLINDYGLRQSMSRKGNCWDNAPQESFFGHMKDELAKYIKSWTCFNEARDRIDDWIDYYNSARCQWQLYKLSPDEFYRYITTGENPISKV